MGYKLNQSEWMEDDEEKKKWTNMIHVLSDRKPLQVLSKLATSDKLVPFDACQPNILLFRQVKGCRDQLQSWIY